MFKEQTLSGWATISFFLGCGRTRKSKTHCPSSLFRVDLSMHSPSSFPFGRESHAEIQKPYSFRKSFVMLENPESPLTHIQNIISVLGGPRRAFAILQSWGKYIQGPPKLKGPGPKNPRIKGATENGVLL